MKQVLRLICAGCALGSSLAAAQTGAPAGSSGPAPVVGQEPPSIGELSRKHRGSLLKATMEATQPTMPGATVRPRLGSVSFTMVPPAEPRTIKKHDLVTIIIREQSEISSEGSTDLKKDASLDARLEEIFQLQGGKLKGGGVSSPVPSIKMSGQRDFKGEAQVDRSDSFVARITAEVVEVRPNGTLALAARKRIKTDEEEQEFILTGFCRTQDVTVDNTVLSTQCYDLNLEKNHRGAVRDTQKRGLVPRLLDFVNPF